MTVCMRLCSKDNWTNDLGYVTYELPALKARPASEPTKIVGFQPMIENVLGVCDLKIHAVGSEHLLVMNIFIMKRLQ